MKPRLPQELLQKARDLRRNPTDAEQRLWPSLCGRQMCGFKFRRQHPIGPYIADFYSHEAQLVIEIDGGQHGEDNQRLYYEKRTAYLEAQGIRVLRFWNHHVFEETESVLEVIRHALVARRGSASG